MYISRTQSAEDEPLDEAFPDFDEFEDKDEDKAEDRGILEEVWVDIPRVQPQPEQQVCTATDDSTRDADDVIFVSMTCKCPKCVSEAAMQVDTAEVPSSPLTAEVPSGPLAAEVPSGPPIQSAAAEPPIPSARKGGQRVETTINKKPAFKTHAKKPAGAKPKIEKKKKNGVQVQSISMPVKLVERKKSSTGKVPEAYLMHKVDGRARYIAGQNKTQSKGYVAHVEELNKKNRGWRNQDHQRSQRVFGVEARLCFR